MNAATAAHVLSRLHMPCRQPAVDIVKTRMTRRGLPGEEVLQQEGVQLQSLNAQVLYKHAALCCAGSYNEAWQAMRQLHCIWRGHELLAK